ncbi:pleckstrin homology domain-containing family G member 5 isoform X2 [Nothobranchius furzeri]|uniref:Pleckstrin homology and RhoGEF domain containing G5 n=1 Tax=Nothobranchius furzeri TaxID=105023 RepID=A0A8C6KVR5_NOTFU|nr:pleckstrin homology domain-containing family G member 5 isoform X2 [Nothobranchius furzeri]KAF7209204.1 transcript variant X4 [Nothobranchius furzeri]
MVPNKWTMNSALHKSPPRSWLGLRLRLNDKPVQEEDWVVCQHPECPDRRRASKVCHHPDCQDLNNKSPLHLCESCDSRCHSESTSNVHFDRHPRFDLQPQASILARNVSTRSCPPRTSPPSDMEEDEEGERKMAGMMLGKKKPRRHTDLGTECFSLKFDLNVDINTEIVPAAKKKTLREVLGPVFERNGVDLSRVDLFLDQSNTPLSLHFEAYRFGGHYLKVKARPGDELKVEQGVKDLRSLSLPNMKPSGGQSPYILAPAAEKVAHESLTRRESVDPLGQARRRKNIIEFLGETNIPTQDSLGPPGGSLPSVGTGPDSWKNRAASRFSVLFSSNAGAGPFVKEVDRLEQLQSKLHSYSTFGLPKVPRQITFHQDSWEEEEEEANLAIEESWQTLLDDPESLTKRQFHQQEAIWELLHTEATYIKKLRVITDLFLSGLLNLQESGLLTEVEPAKLFSNIQEVVRLHTSLWNQVMVPVLEKAREARAPLDPTHLHGGFSTFGSRFQPYIRYCMEEESCMEHMRTLLKDNELFRTYVTWAETKKQCNRLKLADMLAKPHQRLTKYPLLLKSIAKKTDEPSARDIVSSMVATVEDFINSVDSQMRQRQERQKLATISARIDSYEAVEGSSEEVEKILKEYNHFDLMAPMRGTSPEETRQLHLEGALRMKEGKDSRMEVYCFLFTDLLLITKPVKRVEKVKIVRQPLLIHNVVCKELKDPGSFVLVYLNEFKSAVAAYTFQANSATQGRSWIDAVCNVQNQLQKLHTQEMLRQQDILKRCPEEEEEEEEEDESSNSTASSPVLRRKNEQNSSQSDGSTETLSVMDVDEPVEQQQPSASKANLEEITECAAALHSESSEVQQSTRRGDPLPPEHGPEVLDPQRRSLSMDSAYGTLSPESLLRELQLQPVHSEGEETEEEGFQEVELSETGTEEVGELEEEQESRRSQLSKPHQRPPVQPILHCLQKLSSFALSRSEDNLLQCFHGDSPISHTHSLSSNSEESQSGDTSSLPHSKSLSELRRNGLNRSEDCLSARVASNRLQAGLSRADAVRCRRVPDGLCEELDGDAAPSRFPERKNQSGTSGDSGEVSRKKRKSPAQQHKKLTLAQLYRIRTTLVLNSTLTASEV